MWRWLSRQFVENTAALGAAGRGMIANKMRAGLSMLGIAIGVATLMAIQSMVSGLTQTITDQFASLGANTIYVTKFPWVMRGDWWRYKNRPPITKQDVEALRRNAPLLAAVAPVAQAVADVTYLGKDIQLVQVMGTTEEFLDASTFTIESGRFLTSIDDELQESVVVIGADLKQGFFKTGSAIGNHINIRGERFLVIGVLGPQGKSFGRDQDNVVLVPLGRFERLFGNKRNLSIAVTVPPDHQFEAQDQLTEVLRRQRSLASFDDDNFSLNRQQDLQRMADNETGVVFNVFRAIGLIALIVGAIGVMNIMLVAVTERTREIGVRRALGARRTTILMQFLIEAMLVTVVGGGAGTALGLYGAHLISEVTPVPAQASALVAIVGIVVSAIVGLAAGAWPAYRAASLDPIESLRYE